MNQAILTLMAGKKEVLKITPEMLTARGCEFTCDDEQVNVFRDEKGALGLCMEFQIKLGLFPHTGPRPQYMLATGDVVSVRRCTQSSYRISMNFKDVGQDGYRLIAEHLSDSVVPLHHEESKSA
ncbi:MAG TPA: hypothetical protein DIC30_07025 [Oceanospirillales bacterium]|jgi:hypothetical protein|nr:hypothetical protein [Oceanospirillales bacterium]|tara:strand:+ start:7936 stop:8307 length:372 start_codon:yes stop_codon:yes gene_type:complete